MYPMSRFFLFLFFLNLAPSGLSQDGGATITVTVTNIPGAKGELLIGLYDSAGSFTRTALPGSPKVPVTSRSKIRAKIPNVKPGTYAIVVIQDLNGNGRLDKNFVGMPKEPLAFSVIRKIPRGKPQFAACSFKVGTKDISMTIPLVVE